MIVSKNERGFEEIHWPDKAKIPTRLVAQSSSQSPRRFKGAAHLLIGADHILSPLQVKRLIGHLQSWVDTGSLTHVGGLGKKLKNTDCSLPFYGEIK